MNITIFGTPGGKEMKVQLLLAMFCIFGLSLFAAEFTAFGKDVHATESSTVLIYLPAIARPYANETICNGGQKTVVLLIDTSFIEGIRHNVRQYAQDLCADGFTVIERGSTFHDPGAIRAYLSQMYAHTNGQLSGALLIGDIPYAYQWLRVEFTNPNIPPLEEEVISFQYYADLDGQFGRSTSYISPGGHPYSFDIHSGETDWEIWIGVLPMYKGDYVLTTQAINAYFAKNHAYRNGQTSIPRAFLQITEHFTASTPEEHNQFLSLLRDGTFAWTPFSNSSSAEFYFDSTPAALTVMQGYSRMSTGVADFTVADAHGSAYSHGEIDIAWVETNPINTVFFWSNGCAVGNLDQEENFLAEILYSPTSKVLIAKGTTNSSGGMGTNQEGFFGHNIATSLSNGNTFGQAILDHVNVPLKWPWSDSREYHYATPIILGDPALRLRQ